MRILDVMSVGRYWRVALPAAALTASAAALAYAAYEPVPPYVQDRMAVRIIAVTNKLMLSISKTVEYFGIAKPMTMTQSMLSAISPTPKSTNSVTFSYRQFAHSNTVVATPADAKDCRGAAVVFIHGGGWCIGLPELYGKLMSELAESIGVTVFGIRYRLAPEHPFPAAFDDSLAAVEAIFDEAESMGIDPSRIAIGGDSAGGQLTAAIVQHLRVRKSRHRPKAQILMYPATQFVNLHTKSITQNVREPILSPKDVSKAFATYLLGDGDKADQFSSNLCATPKVQAAYLSAVGEELPVEANEETRRRHESTELEDLVLDYRVSPLLNPDIDRLDLPPTLVIACEFDPIRDDALMYARRLERAGVKVELKKYQKYHGAMTMPNDGKEIRDDIFNFLKQKLNP